MQEIIIGPNQAGQRFDKFLNKYLPNAGNSFLYKMLRKKNITLNGRKAEGKEMLAKGDIVRTFFAEETFAKFSGQPIAGDRRQAADITSYQQAFQALKGITVLQEDDDKILLNKPAGILTQKAKDSDFSLNEWLIGYLLSSGGITPAELATFKPSVCNRLDRNTSGIVLCGKSLSGSQRLNEMIRTREVSKFYRTICVGKIKETAYLEGYLTKASNTNRVQVSGERKTPEDHPIHTAYAPIKTNGNFTLLEVELITGKTHQIRAHLSSIGHPLIGDFKYGNPGINQELKARYGLTYQLLHAYRIEFPDGTEVTAPYSEQFTAVMESLFPEP